MSHRSSVSPWSLGTAAAVLVAGAFAAIAGPGCSSASDEYRCDDTGCYECDSLGCRPVVPKTPTPCGYAGDVACKAGEVCTSAGCLIPCADSSSCEKGLVCKKGFCTPPKVDPTPTTCTTGADCTALSATAACVDGKCVEIPKCEGAGCSCKYSSECDTGKICVDSKCEAACGAGLPACATGFDCDAKGFCKPSATPTCGGTTGKTCKTGEKCIDGRCSAGCAADTECLGADGKADPGQRCIGGACVPDTRPDTKCTGDASCATGTEKCVDGFCRRLCGTNDECLKFDARIGACSKIEGFCRRPEELTAACTKKADCTSGKDCVDGACK